MTQIFSHVCEGAVVVVYNPVRHRQRVDSGRASAAEAFQLVLEQQTRVRVSRLKKVCLRTTR